MSVLGAGERSLKRHFDRRGQLSFVRAVQVECQVDRKAGLLAITPHLYFSYFVNLVNLFRKHVLRRLANDPIHEPKRAGGCRLHPRQAPGSTASDGGPYPKRAHLKPVALLRRPQKRAWGQQSPLPRDEGRRGGGDRRQRRAVEGLRPILPSRKDEHGREVEAHRPSIPPYRRFAAGRTLRGRGCLLRGRRPPSSLGGPLPRRANARSRRSRVPPQAPSCAGTCDGEEQASSLVPLIHPRSAWKMSSWNQHDGRADREQMA